ncbi:MAG TPA: hypothetical protein VG268_06690 [Streptosporangiaceae bacterium]|jgi:hypothetical protein|nr:hypothetical protein [Streptosporangiaceae bacterium]
MSLPTPTLARQPTLASSCARAATAAETRFRIDYPDRSRRDSRVIALDERTAGLIQSLAASADRWRGGHFLAFSSVVPAGDDARLRTPDGAEVLLSQELDHADVVVMLAGPTGDTGASAAAAAVIGDACAARFIMSAGLVLPGGPVDAVISALRPNAMVLVILQESDDVAEVLSALRV